jgi:DNA-binding IclR family transcriptional regulator
MAHGTSTSSTVRRALAVLEIIAGSKHPVTLNEVAEQINSDKSTTYRMLTTLIDAGYVVRSESTRRYQLSYKVVSLSRNLLAENEVFQLSRQVMEDVTRLTLETVHLCILDGNQTVLVQKIKGTQLVAVDFQVGDRSPLHCTSIGKALLAYQDARAIDDVIRAGLPASAVNTITDPTVFAAELQRVRERGYAIDDRELANNMRCIAAPIFERDGRVQMGLSISGPDSRFTLDYLQTALRPALLNATSKLSSLLGGAPWIDVMTTQKVVPG